MNLSRYSFLENFSKIVFIEPFLKNKNISRSFIGTFAYFLKAYSMSYSGHEDGLTNKIYYLKSKHYII